MTFCAANAIDVFLFLKEGLLSRDPHTDVILGTYFCEKDPREFNEISQRIGAHEQGFLGSFEDMILFEDDDRTRHLNYDDPSQRHPYEIRQRLLVKKRHQRLRVAAPFDVVNLDICGTFFPPAGGIHSPMFQSIQRLLDWQTEFSNMDKTFNSFTTFLTTHVEDGLVNDEAMEQLIVMVEDNQASHADFSSDLHSRFGTGDVRQIAINDFSGFYCVALPKVIVGAAFQRGWRATARFLGCYQRTRKSVTGVPSTRLFDARLGG